MYVDAQLAPATALTLDPERSHYLCRVLRQRRGDHVLLFCGDGIGYDARIDDPDPRACRVSILEIAETEAPPRLKLHLGQAMIKGERLDFVLQKATELGVTDIWLLETQRTEVRYAGSRVARRETHWQRIVQGAAEQSRRLTLPTAAPADFAARAADAAARTSGVAARPGRAADRYRAGRSTRCCSSDRKAASATRSARRRTRRAHDRWAWAS